MILAIKMVNNIKAGFKRGICTVCGDKAYSKGAIYCWTHKPESHRPLSDFEKIRRRQALFFNQQQMDWKPETLLDWIDYDNIEPSEPSNLIPEIGMHERITKRNTPERIARIENTTAVGPRIPNHYPTWNKHSNRYQYYKYPMPLPRKVYQLLRYEGYNIEDHISLDGTEEFILSNDKDTVRLTFDIC